MEASGVFLFLVLGECGADGDAGAVSPTLPRPIF